MSHDDERDRRLVEEAFRRTRVPPSPGFSSRLRRRLDRERVRRAGGPGFLTSVLAGATLVLMLVGGLLVDSGYLDLPIDSRPAAPPASATLAQDVPSSSDVQPTFLLPRAAGEGGANAFSRLDWSGRTVGSFDLPLGAPGVTVSPDGSLAAIPDGTGPGAEIVDASGRPVEHLPVFGSWSSDGVHAACALITTGRAPSVEVTDLDAPGSVAPVARRVSGPSLPDGTWVLAGCSAYAGTLVALRLERGAPGPDALVEADVIQLSTGRVVSHLTYTGGSPVTAPVLSHGGRYLAENDPVAGSAAIRDLESGDVVGHVAGTVEAFSGDDQQVLTDAGLAGTSRSPRAAVVDWRWGRSIWTAAGLAQPLAIRPGGRDLVVSLTGGPGSDARTLLVAVASGRVIDLGAHPADGGQQLG